MFLSIGQKIVRASITATGLLSLPAMAQTVQEAPEPITAPATDVALSEAARTSLEQRGFPENVLAQKMAEGAGNLDDYPYVFRPLSDEASYHSLQTAMNYIRVGKMLPDQDSMDSVEGYAQHFSCILPNVPFVYAHYKPWVDENGVEYPEIFAYFDAQFLTPEHIYMQPSPVYGQYTVVMTGMHAATLDEITASGIGYGNYLESLIASAEKLPENNLRGEDLPANRLLSLGGSGAMVNGGEEQEGWIVNANALERAPQNFSLAGFARPLCLSAMEFFPEDGIVIATGTPIYEAHSALALSLRCAAAMGRKAVDENPDLAVEWIHVVQNPGYLQVEPILRQPPQVEIGERAAQALKKAAER